jgi:hypothetical protein
MEARLQSPSVQAFPRRHNSGSQAEQTPQDMVGIMPDQGRIVGKSFLWTSSFYAIATWVSIPFVDMRSARRGYPATRNTGKGYCGELRHQIVRSQIELTHFKPIALPEPVPCLSIEDYVTAMLA